MKYLSKTLAPPAIALALISTAPAAVTWTNGVGDRDWGNADNWTTEVPILDEFGEPVLDEFGDPTFESVAQLPTGADKTNVHATPGPVLSGAGDTKELDVGGTLDVAAGGDLMPTGWFIIGYGASQNGTVTVDAGSINANSSHLSVGFFGTGTLNVQNGGSVALTANNLIVGFNDGSTGNVNLTGGSIAAQNGKDIEIGKDGTGTITVSGGSMTGTDDLFVGKGGTGVGTLKCQGGTVHINDRVYLTDNSNAEATLEVTGGAFSCNDHLYAGHHGQGTVTMTSGSITTSGTFYLGNNGYSNGTMTMTGGTLTTSSVLMVGNVSGSIGTLTLENGDIQVGSLAYVGNSGTGLIDMTGGTITIPNDKPLVIGRNTDSSGEVLLKGGTISAGSLEFNHSSQGPSLLSHLDITGGTLILAGNHVDTINGFIVTGEITTAYGSSSLLSVVHDVDTDKTTVTAAPADNAFADWAVGYPTMIGGYDTDGDMDGATNGEEWDFFGTDPTVPQAHGQKGPRNAAQSAPGNLTFTHKRPVDRTGFTESFEWSTTLGDDWTVDGASNGTHTVSFTLGTPVPDGTGYETVEVTATAAPNTLSGLFARMRLESN